MGNLMSMRGGFLGHATSGGGTHREKDSLLAGRFLVTATCAFDRFDSIAIVYSITIHRLDISKQDTAPAGGVSV
jgi:hypothetical protein